MKNLDLRIQIQQLITQIGREIEQIPEDDLEQVCNVLEPLYYDLYAFRAILEAQQNLKPGDSLTRDEALQFLQLL
ncbi:hypothetical protein [Oxynema aestuarii]|uniref:Uncharacterized protein n=1 Tax=Oxynema aestuarii AP17 TaxID=2064643 RepID=A0A6H1U062_9CYAN|nr:hypothetical protein [Oxynema aestuarii]QIZ72224.1 hypothetical protein HCG48_17940 [Oxynema aestuarii AP17]RMH77401.1 MAG: hypothetical protein D6680_05245 [Cyanobacteria bacterium J007]